MLIDWFTVAAQAFNFLILVWLLKRFLYAPILAAIDAREKHINAELANADAKRREAEALGDVFRLKSDEFDTQRTALLSQAVDEAVKERQRMLDAARQEADSLRIRQQDQLKAEYSSLSEQIARSTQTEVFAIAKKTLMDLAGERLDARMVQVFMDRLNGIEIDVQPAADTPFLVRSANDLSAEQRLAIEEAIKHVFHPAANFVFVFVFDVVPDLVAGIELVVQGKKYAWSIADYLASLEKGVNELLRGKSAADSGSK